MIVMLARRLVLVVLAFAVAFAPVALEACQVACAVHSVAAGATGAGNHHREAAREAPVAHSCHDAAAAPVKTSVALTGGVHRCNHSDALPINAGALAQQVLHAPAILPALVDYTPLQVSTSRHAPTSLRRDSIPVALNLPLRL
jgi:hypothetical protein